MLFGKKVEAVNTLNQVGKNKRFKGRLGKRPGYKKAIVTLQQGESHRRDRISVRKMIMALKKFRPITPSTRHLVMVDRSELWSGKPVKTLTVGLPATGGRNNNGRMTNRNIGGRHKRRYRLVDFKRQKFDVEGTVERLEYDPKPNSFYCFD